MIRGISTSTALFHVPVAVAGQVRHDGGIMQDVAARRDGNAAGPEGSVERMLDQGLDLRTAVSR